MIEQAGSARRDDADLNGNRVLNAPTDPEHHFKTGVGRPLTAAQSFGGGISGNQNAAIWANSANLSARGQSHAFGIYVLVQLVTMANSVDPADFRTLDVANG
jgi:hypothetical protein